MSEATVSPGSWGKEVPEKSPALYFPGEGFGALYRRVMLNEMLSTLIAESPIRSVAEFPMDPHGAAGAGSLILGALGRELTLISDQDEALDRARSLYEQRGLSHVTYVCRPLDATALPDNAVDLSWSFDRVQATRNPAKTVAEIARVSKSALIIIPNANNYGQWFHFIYHQWTRSGCDYVGPRRWMRESTVSQALSAVNMEIVATGIIDAPWWPGFPELPALVRGALKGQPVNRPNALEGSDRPDLIVRLIRRAQRSNFIECSSLPGAVKHLFAHNVFVLAVKPAYRALITCAHPEPAYRAHGRPPGPLLRLCA